MWLPQSTLRYLSTSKQLIEDMNKVKEDVDKVLTQRHQWHIDGHVFPRTSAWVNRGLFPLECRHLHKDRRVCHKTRCQHRPAHTAKFVRRETKTELMKASKKLKDSSETMIIIYDDPTSLHKRRRWLLTTLTMISIYVGQRLRWSKQISSWTCKTRLDSTWPRVCEGGELLLSTCARGYSRKSLAKSTRTCQRRWHRTRMVDVLIIITWETHCV